MAGTKQLAFFGILALLGSVSAAPACDSKSRSRGPRPTGTSSAVASMSAQPIVPSALSIAAPPAIPTKVTPVAGDDEDDEEPADEDVVTLPVDQEDDETPVSAPPTPVAGGAAAKPLSLSSTLIYDLDNVGIGGPVVTSSSGVKIDAGVYIVDMAGHSAAQIKAYKDAGKTVICYFSAGTLEPFRDDAKAFDAACACGPGGTLNADNECTGGSGKTKMDDWNEYWLDLHSATCKTSVRDVQAQRIKAAKAKGCDGMDPDNVDSYNNGSPHGNTEADQVDYLLWLSKTIHAEGMVVTLKNSPDLIQGSSGQAIVDAFDLSVIESCAQYDECDAYDPFLAAGKPQIQIEYSNSIKTCPTLKAGQNLAVYSGDLLDSKDITLNCPGAK